MSGFSHPNAGREVRVKQHGRVVQLEFVCSTRAIADTMRADLLRQLKAGALNVTLMGKPASITET